MTEPRHAENNRLKPPVTTRLQSRRELEAIRAAAQEEGLTISQLGRRALLEHIGYQPKETTTT